MPAGRAVVAPAVRSTGAALRSPRRNCDSRLGPLRPLSFSPAPVSAGRTGSYLRSRTSPLLARLASPRGGGTSSSIGFGHAVEGIPRSASRKVAMRRWSSTTDLSHTATTATTTTRSSPPGPDKAPAPKTPAPAPTHNGGSGSGSGSGRTAAAGGLRRPKVHQTNVRPSLGPLFRLSAAPASEDGLGVRPAEDGISHVLESVALECDLVLSQYRQASEATRGELLWAALGCLLDVSRRPGLPEALTSRGRGGQQPASKLRIHRAFITLLSAAAEAVANAQGEVDTRQGRVRQQGPDDGISAQPVDQVMRLARQAHRLDLPLPFPLYQRLAQMASSADASEGGGEVSFVAVPGARGGSRVSAAASMLLEIADWQASEGVAQPSTAFHSVDELDGSPESTDSSKALRGATTRLRFLVPALQRLVVRRQYGVVMETISSLLIRGGGGGQEPRRVADFDALFALMMAARQGVESSPAHVTEIRQILELLEPSVEEMMSSNEALLRSHPHVRNFLHRYFLSDVDDALDADADADDDPYEVWDPVVADLLKPHGDPSNGSDAALKDRIATVSDFYAAMDAAVDAKLVHFSRVHHFPFRSEAEAVAGASSSSSSDDDDNDEEEGHEDSDWSSDSDGDSESMSGFKFPGGDATEVAVRRHHMYVRGRGRALDAGYLPDVTAQAVHLHNGLNFRYTDEYESWLWKRDFQDEDDDDDLSLLTLHDSDNDPFSSGDDDDDDDDGDHSR